MSYLLRELSREDIPYVNMWRNDRDVINSLGAPFRFINREIDEIWFSSYVNNRANCVRLAVVKEVDKKIIGAVYLTGIDWLTRSAEFSIWIGDKGEQGKGAGKFAAMGMLRHAFLDLGLNRIHLTVISENNRARKLYTKVGFKDEGVMRQAVFKNGKYVDAVMMSILASEYSLSCKW